MIDLNPDHVLLIASGLWVGAALATGLPDRRIPSDYPFLFSLIAACAALVGFGDFLPPSGDAVITILGVLLFAVAPIIMTAKLYYSYPPAGKRPLQKVGD